MSLLVFRRWRELWRRQPRGLAESAWRSEQLQLLCQLWHALPGDRVLVVESPAGRVAESLVCLGSPSLHVHHGKLAENGAAPPRLLTEFHDGHFDHAVFVDSDPAARIAPGFWEQLARVMRPGGMVVHWESRRTGAGDPLQLQPHPSLEPVLRLTRDFEREGRAKRVRPLSGLIGDCLSLPRPRAASIVAFRKPSDGALPPFRNLCRHASLVGEVSVVIPCFNEAANVASIVAGLIGYYGDYLREIIPVDDNSSDDTRSILACLAETEPRVRPVFRQGPRGVGRALSAGFAAAQGEYVLSIDCDFQHLLPELNHVFDAAAQGHDVVLGTRFVPGTYLHGYPLSKLLANRLFHCFARHVVRSAAPDVSNNLKLFRRSSLKRVRITQPGFAANAELGVQLLMHGCSAAQVPVSWCARHADMGTSSFRLVPSGGGYARVLANAALATLVGRGPYTDSCADSRRHRDAPEHRGDRFPLAARLAPREALSETTVAPADRSDLPC